MSPRTVFRHSATASGESLYIDMVAGANARFMPSQSGTFDYICKYHSGMKARLIVLP